MTAPNKLIVKSWLIVGSLDITAAIIQTLIYKGSILNLMQFIASGVLVPMHLTEVIVWLCSA